MEHAPERPSTKAAPTPTVPDGYKKDAIGRLVPLEIIKPVDLLRDETVRDIVARAERVTQELATFKAWVFGVIDAFVALSAERFGVSWGGEKGNLLLLSYDGSLKVILARDEYMTFDERLQVAKQLVDECLRAWSQGSDPKIKAIVEDAFQVDRAGRVNTRRILSLRRLQIDDPTWQRAMDAIGESLTIGGSKAYVRCYRRRAATDEWDQIPLDFSSVPLATTHTEEAAQAA